MSVLGTLSTHMRIVARASCACFGGVPLAEIHGRDARATPDKILRPDDPKIAGALSTRFKRCVRHCARAGELDIAGTVAMLLTQNQTQVTKPYKA